MDITPKFKFVEGSFNTKTNRMLVIASDNHGTVELCSRKRTVAGTFRLPRLNFSTADCIRTSRQQWKMPGSWAKRLLVAGMNVPTKDKED